MLFILIKLNMLNILNMLTMLIMLLMLINDHTNDHFADQADYDEC